MMGGSRSVVRAFVRGAMGRRIDSVSTKSRSSQCFTTGVTKAVVWLSCLWDGADKRTLAANWKE